MNDVAQTPRRDIARPAQTNDLQQYVSLTIADQMFGIPVLTVHDVLTVQRITPVPLAPKEVAGSLNLRGRIVTAIDVRYRLGLDPRPAGKSGMSVVVEHGGESYSLMIDSVGEVLALPGNALERNPVTMDPRWRAVSLGIFRLNQQLLVIMDINKLLDFTAAEAA